MSAWPSPPPLSFGDAAPWFFAPTHESKKFHFNTSAGRYTLLAFFPADVAVRAAFLKSFALHRRLFNDANLTAFGVVSDPQGLADVEEQTPGLRWFLDADQAVSRLYGQADGEEPFCLLIDPSLRIMARAPLADHGAIFELITRLPEASGYAGVELHAPVLIAPRIFEPEFCRRLMAAYDTEGGRPSGVMRDVDGRTVAVMGDFKRRSDVMIEDEAFRREIMTRLRRRLAPEIQRVFQFKPTRMERYLVACYDAETGGYFRPHRDNETFATAHRVFAVSINLNAEDFEGGDLRFPEFGRRTYRPPSGGAVVFSCSLQHEATPVTRGRRYAFLPFLYDEARQEIREANLGKLDADVVLQDR